MKGYKEFTAEEIFKELTLSLKDAGLNVNFYSGNYKNSNHPKFNGEFHIEIEDVNKLFCKNYPKDDMDWLYGKNIINEFLIELDDFGFKRDKDYKVYAGGTGVNIVFDKIERIKL